MQLSFVKGDKHDRVYVARNDGSEAHWSFPSYGPAGMPHDLVHFAVESALPLRDGLFARVAAGADLRRIGDVANRTGGPLREKYAALGQVGGFDGLDGVLFSEAMAAAPWQSEPRDEAVARAIAEACASYGIAMRRPLPIEALRAALQHHRARWLAVAIGRALVVHWDG